MKTITITEFDKLPEEEQRNFTGIVKWRDGTITYLENGKWHREDGPASIWSNGYQSWHFEGLLHNLNGPAIIFPNGKEEYWIHDKKTSKEAADFLRDLLKLKGNKNAR